MLTIKVIKCFLSNSINEWARLIATHEKQKPVCVSFFAVWTLNHIIWQEWSVRLGTIPILRQQKDWVGGFGKWPIFLTFSTVFMLSLWVDGLKKSKIMLTLYRDGPLGALSRYKVPYDPEKLSLEADHPLIWWNIEAYPLFGSCVD